VPRVPGGHDAGEPLAGDERRRGRSGEHAGRVESRGQLVEGGAEAVAGRRPRAGLVGGRLDLGPELFAGERPPVAGGDDADAADPLDGAEAP
jgi:hypothetical protein